MLWILLHSWSSWCMRLITYLYFLLRLQISAVVTVLPLNVFMVQGLLYLLPLFWRNESNIYVDVILSHRKWRRCGVTEHCVILLYCVVSKHTILLSDDRYRTWNLENLSACWFSFCVMLIYYLCLSPWHLLQCSDLCCLDSWYANFLAVFPKLSRVWHALTHVGHDIWHFLKWVQMCFLQEVQFRILPCTVHIISFTDREEERPITA
jgi:hypothetical protein